MLTIVEQPEAQAAKDEAETRWERASLVWDNLTWVVARDPEVGIALTESGRTRAATEVGARSIGMPDLTIVYEVNPPFLIVHRALFTEPKYRDVGRA